MKRVIFLIIASLMMLGLVLPGCGGGPTPEEEVVYTFSSGYVRVGVCNDFGTAGGDLALLGANLGAAQINALGGVTVGSHTYNISLVPIDTDEYTDLTGISGKLAVIANLNNCDFFIGGFRTESIVVYRDEVMNAKKFFFNCGAATATLQQSVAVAYNTYKYWFKMTPYNEYFLAKNVVKLVDTVARELRVQRSLPAGTLLNAVIISENLKWARDEQVPQIKAMLPGINVTWKATYLVDSLTPGPTQNAVAWAVGNQTVGNYSLDFFIPLYSGSMGVAFDGSVMQAIAANTTDAMAVGINVPNQVKSPWLVGVGINLTSPPPYGPYCQYMVHLDTYAAGVNQSVRTYPFVSAFGAYTTGVYGYAEYPNYMAGGTFDALFALKQAITANGWDNGANGAVNATPLIQWLENPVNTYLGTTGLTCVYPPAGTSVGGIPALTAAQVASLGVMPGGWTYDVNAWKMPPNTVHDLVYGVNRATGLGAQWQWTGAAWEKKGIWPRVIPGANLTDQYGDWNFAYNGTVNLTIPSFALDGHL